MANILFSYYSFYSW